MHDAAWENDHWEQKKEITRHRDSNPMISCLGPLVTRWGGGGSATSTHGQLQPTVKEHTQQHSSQQGLLLRGPAQGLDVTDTRRKASGHCVRPHLTHWHGDGRRAAPSPPHTYTQIPESSTVQTRVKARQARIPNSPRGARPDTVAGLASE